MRMAGEADALICIVAHCYGHVPPAELGGDGKRSITWLEVDAAQRAGKPVFAFTVDPTAPWTGGKEQDRLTLEPQEKADEIAKAVQRLNEFKAYLDRACMRRTFTGLADLDVQVTAALANFIRKPAQVITPAHRVWRPLFCHALQPAHHFRGRESKLRELKEWLQAAITPDRVVSIVAVGGTGKTALVEKALHEAKLTNRAGVFVWSFYEDPRTDAFVRAAHLYFTGDTDAPTGGMLELLQLALSGDVPHVLILDGLERVQSEGQHRPRGELEDLPLKRLVRSLAGGVGNSRALVTSRFPLVDLDAWTGVGYRPIALDDLEESTALEVLRAWKVKGDDTALTRLLEPLHADGLYHALSVAVLGSYIGNFAGGDPRRGPEFSLEDAEEADPKARRLNRILEQYSQALCPAERDLLARLSLFPRGVRMELLNWIVQSGGAVAGALANVANRQLMSYLERLKALGLAFCYPVDGQVVYSAHPFLREFFREFLGTAPEQVHESVRAKLAPNLEARPTINPSETAILDRYELLIEQTLLAGRAREAFHLYRDVLGGYGKLGWVLGENVRGLRILELFAPQDDFSRAAALLPPGHESTFVNEFGIFADRLGDLARARRSYAYCLNLDNKASEWKRTSLDLGNLASLEFNSGNFRQALGYSESAVQLARVTKDRNRIGNALAMRAISEFSIGNIRAALDDFHAALELQGEAASYVIWACDEAMCRLLRGDPVAAFNQTRSNRGFAIENSHHETLCRCNALLARILAPNNFPESGRRLQEARAFASRSGAVELQLHCFHAACEHQLRCGDYHQAIDEAEAGVLLADTCGFEKFSIDLRLALAETLLAAGEVHRGLKNALDALDRSGRPHCAYAWGEADGLHFSGVAHLHLGEHELAHRRLVAALELRERLGHGRIDETRSALRLCGA